VFYPNTSGAIFDMPYYLRQHTPMVEQKLGAALKRMLAEHGTEGSSRCSTFNHQNLTTSVMTLSDSPQRPSTFR
jgi:hypothetical protein